MSWNPEPQDLDLHVMQIDRSTGAILCHCFYGNKQCPGFNLDVDNTQVIEKLIKPLDPKIWEDSFFYIPMQ